MEQLSSPIYYVKHGNYVVTYCCSCSLVLSFSNTNWRFAVVQQPLPYSCTTHFTPFFQSLHMLKPPPPPHLQTVLYLIVLLVAFHRHPPPTRGLKTPHRGRLSPSCRLCQNQTQSLSLSLSFFLFICKSCSPHILVGNSLLVELHFPQSCWNVPVPQRDVLRWMTFPLQNILKQAGERVVLLLQ